MDGLDLVPVGEVMGAHGVRGELKVKNHNPESDLLLELEDVFLQQGAAEPERRRVLDARSHGKGLIMRLAGCKDRDQAKALYGAQLAVPRTAFPEPEEDEFYLVDAIGARAYLSDGQEIGVVESFRAYPTVDVFCVRSNDRSLREVPLIPPYLVSVDTAAGRVVVDHFFDLEPEPGEKPGT